MARSNASSLLAAALTLFWTPLAAAQQLSLDQRFGVTVPQLQLPRRIGDFAWVRRDPVVLGDHSRPVSIGSELAPPTESVGGARRHVLAGLAGGVTTAAVGATIALSPGSGCTGSGNYLELCRLAFAGSLVVGAGLGSLVGVLIRSEPRLAVPLDSLQFDVLLGGLRPGQSVRVRLRTGDTGEARVRPMQGDAMALSLRGSLVPLSTVTLDSLWIRPGPDRVAGGLMGAAVATLSLFVVSILACEQGGDSNRAIICGYSGMPSVGSMVAATGVGAVFGAAVGFPSRTWRLRYTTSLAGDAR